MREVNFDDYEKPDHYFPLKTFSEEELKGKNCGGCKRCKKRNHSYNGKSKGFHCTMQYYDVDILQTNQACEHYWDREKFEKAEKEIVEATENRRKELWAIYSEKEPVKLPIVNDGYGMIPECPVCGEMPYSTEQCHWCGQRFVQDEEVKEYSEPLTKEMECLDCGKKVIANISKYNGHFSYHCKNCGCHAMS